MTCFINPPGVSPQEFLSAYYPIDPLLTQSPKTGEFSGGMSSEQIIKRHFGHDIVRITVSFDTLCRNHRQVD